LQIGYFKMQKQRYFISLSYNGKAYHGWQIQKNAITIQQILNEKLSLKFREPVELVGAGRTDTGVHAHFFVAHFDAYNKELDNISIVNALNSFLPADITIYQIIKVKQNAHARFDTIQRTYHYYLSSKKSSFFNNFYLNVPHLPDIVKMNDAAKKLLTVSDFTSFVKLHSNNKTNICKVTYAKWKLISNEEIVFVITADRFLRNMVRAITGTLMNIGYAKLSSDIFLDTINRKDRHFAALTVPAHGLFLYDIVYPDKIFMQENTILEKPKKLF